MLLLSLLRRIPGVAYVVALCLALLLVAGWSIYRTGYSHGEVTVHRIALQDSVAASEQQIDTAVQETHRARGTAQTAKRWSDSSRVTRQEKRASVEELLAELPEPVVSLIRQDDAQIRRDSATIVAYQRVDSTWMQERFARIERDSLLARQVRLGVPKSGTSRLVPFVSGALVGAAALLIYAAVR
jgi:hypothetical protein